MAVAAVLLAGSFKLSDPLLQKLALLQKVLLHLLVAIFLNLVVHLLRKLQGLLGMLQSFRQVFPAILQFLNLPLKKASRLFEGRYFALKTFDVSLISPHFLVVLNLPPVQNLLQCLRVFLRHQFTDQAHILFYGLYRHLADASPYALYRLFKLFAVKELPHY